MSEKIDISNELFDNASVLEDFAVDIRYPDTSVELSDDEIQQAFIIQHSFIPHCNVRLL